MIMSEPIKNVNPITIDIENDINLILRNLITDAMAADAHFWAYHPGDLINDVMKEIKGLWS
jgi:hypothetical protein